MARFLRSVRSSYKSSEREGDTNDIHFSRFDDNKKDNQDIWVVHNPTQIKSATDNIGTYDSTNPDIRYREVDGPLDNQEKKINFAESFNDRFIDVNISQNEYTDDFRRIQEESLGLSQEEIRRYHKGGFKGSNGEIISEFGDEDRRRLGNVYARLLSGSSNAGQVVWTDLTGKGNTFKITRVNGSLFHDIFEVNRNY